MLLPVEPPEVNPHLFVFSKEAFEDGLHVVIVLHGPGEGGSIVVGVSQLLLHLVIIVFVRSHSIRGVQVERGTYPVLMHIGDELLRIGNEICVPAPTGPSVLMPVHVHDEYVHGY